MEKKSLIIIFIVLGVVLILIVGRSVFNTKHVGVSQVGSSGKSSSIGGSVQNNANSNNIPGGAGTKNAEAGVNSNNALTEAEVNKIKPNLGALLGYNPPQENLPHNPPDVKGAGVTFTGGSVYGAGSSGSQAPVTINPSVSKNISECNLLSGQFIDMCKIQVAITLKDESICNQISNSVNMTIYAHSMSNAALQPDIIVSARDYCWIKMSSAKGEDYCSQVSMVNLQSICKEELLVR